MWQTWALIDLAELDPARRSDLLAAAEMVSQRLDPVTRALSLIAIARAGAADRERLLAAAETAAIDLDVAGRSCVVVAVAVADPTDRRVRAAAEAAAAMAAAHIDTEDRASDLMALAKLGPPADVRAGIEAAAAHLDPADRRRVLLTIANTSAIDRERLVASCLDSLVNFDMIALGSIAEIEPKLGPLLVDMAAPYSR